MHCRLENRQSSVPGAPDRYPPSRCATLPEARLHLRPDTEYSYGGDVSLPFSSEMFANAERRLRNIRWRKDHSGLMFANFTTLAHFSVSSAIRRAKSAGEPGSAVLPIAASCAFIFGSASALLVSLLMTAMMSAGVSRGAPKPVRRLAS